MSDERSRSCCQFVAKHGIRTDPKRQESSLDNGFWYEADLDADLIEEQMRIAVRSRDFFYRSKDQVLCFRCTLTGHGKDCEVFGKSSAYRFEHC